MICGLASAIPCFCTVQSHGLDAAIHALTLNNDVVILFTGPMKWNGPLTCID